MIRYRLICEKDHEFDAWFRNSEAFDKQARRGLVSCPDCASTKVSKAIMAPNVAVHDEPVNAPPPAKVDPRSVAQADIMKAMRELRRKVEENAEYVGPRFAEEARRIHYKETEEKGIYGEASLDEAKSLVDEGIEFHPLPILPEDRN